jgi:transposase
MLLEPSANKYLFYLGPTDMRKGFDSLSGIVTGLMHFDPLSSDVYIFINRRRTQLKLLQWEGDGFAIYYKRLEKGTYELPCKQEEECCATISAVQLQMIFQGLSADKKYQRKRYQHEVNNC